MNWHDRADNFVGPVPQHNLECEEDHNTELHSTELRDVLNDLFSWMALSGWAQGRRDGHGRRTRTSLVTLEERVECRCGDQWPCPYMRAWRLATNNPAAGETGTVEH